MKDLVFEKTFRSNFPQFNYIYDRLDILGGKNCKSCNLRQQRLLIRELDRRIREDDNLRKIFSEKYPNQTEGEERIPSAISFEFFKKAMLIEEVRSLLSSTFPKEIEELERKIKTEGYFSEELDNLHMEFFKFYNSNPEFFNSVSSLLSLKKMRNKLIQNNPKCKIVNGSTYIDLENKINEFILDKKIESLTFSGLSAVILYYRVN